MERRDLDDTGFDNLVVPLCDRVQVTIADRTTGAATKLQVSDPIDVGQSNILETRGLQDTRADWLTEHQSPAGRPLHERVFHQVAPPSGCDPTRTSHARTEKARFLGYEVNVVQKDHLHDRTGKRSCNGVVGLDVPKSVIDAKCARYSRNGKPVHRPALSHNAEFSVVEQYQAEYRGVALYYALAHNRHLLSRLRWTMEQSLTKTLAHKLRITVSQVYDRFQGTIATPHGPRRGLTVRVDRGDGRSPLVAHWGGISLTRQPRAVLDDQPQRVWNDRTELVERLLAHTCELCGSTERVQVHHVRALKDLQKQGRAPKPAWVLLMAARQRKTLVVCEDCHVDIHHGRPAGNKLAM